MARARLARTLSSARATVTTPIAATTTVTTRPVPARFPATQFAGAGEIAGQTTGPHGTAANQTSVIVPNVNSIVVTMRPHGLRPAPVRCTSSPIVVMD